MNAGGRGLAAMAVFGGVGQMVSVGVTELLRGEGSVSAKSMALSPLSSGLSFSVAHPCAMLRVSDFPAVTPAGKAGLPVALGRVPVKFPQETQSIAPKSSEMKQAPPPAAAMLRSLSVKSGLPAALFSPTRTVR